MSDDKKAKAGVKQRLLVVAYAFAPASPIGTMRTLRLVRRLHAEGWAATVLTASPSTYLPSMPMDPALMSQVPAGVDVIHAPILRPVAKAGAAFKRTPSSTASIGDVRSTDGAQPRSVLRRVYGAIDDLTSLPDREVGWVAPAVVKGLLAIWRQKPAAIYSSAPPWSGQLAAYLLARLSGLPWIADFRDPWARAPWRESQSARARRTAVILERRVIGRADAVMFATQTNRDEYVDYYGAGTAARFFVVPNGCNPDEFIGLPRSSPEGVSVLIHAGSLYGARTPAPLFNAIASAIEKGALKKDRFRLRLIGAANDERDLQLLADALGLNGVVEFLPRMPRREVLAEMASASALLVLQPGTTVSIPGKLYEYLAIGKPILALCEEGETADLVRRGGSGVAVVSTDVSAIESGLLAVMQLSRQPAVSPARETYDGNLSAGKAVRIIDAVIRGLDTHAITETDRRPTRPVEEAREWRV